MTFTLHNRMTESESELELALMTELQSEPDSSSSPKKASCGKCGAFLIFLIIVGAIIGAAGGLMFIFVDKYIRSQVEDRVVISNTSETYEIWQDVPVPVYMQFYLFNIGNPQEVRDGEKPLLQQFGPFTYRERREKFDIVWNDNGTVTYKQNRTFTFIREMSQHDEDFEITTINPFIATIAEGMQFWHTSLRKLLSWALGLIKQEDIIMTRPVKELLWGYDDPALRLLNAVNKQLFPMTNIGYFIRKNYTDDGLYTVDTGEEDISRLGFITRYNGSTHLDLWTTPWANMVNGTDGSLGPPFRFDAEESPVFVSDICRSIRGVYKGEVETPQGIKLRRFGGDKRDMANATANPDNIGFCTPQTNCLPTGLLNSTLCQLPVNGFKLPVVFSFPHFLDAATSVQESVIGLNPIEEEHQTVIDQEPWTGLVLQVAKRLQINMYVSKVAEVGQTHNIQTLFFPIVWLNESSVVDDHWAEKLQTELFTPMEVAHYGKFGLIGLGGAMVVFCSSFLTYRWRQQTKTVRLKKSTRSPHHPHLPSQDNDLTYDKQAPHQRSQPSTTSVRLDHEVGEGGYDRYYSPSIGDGGGERYYSPGVDEEVAHRRQTIDMDWYDPASFDGDRHSGRDLDNDRSNLESEVHVEGERTNDTEPLLV